MITFTEFAKRKNFIATNTEINELSSLEDSLTAENFLEVSKQMYRVVFKEEPSPDVFTGHKFFLTKVVKEPFTRLDLMEEGLQPFRMVLARHAERLRYPGNDEFDTVGLVKFENFLKPDHARAVIEEIIKFPLIENIQPSNNIDNITKEKTPAIYDLLFNTDLLDICTKAVHRKPDDEAAKAHFLKTTYIQRLQNNPGMNDIQKVCHSDVFYPCLKYWYFPEGVTLEEGPFNFALNSVQLTYEVLDFWYEESIKIIRGTWDRNRNKGHEEGSLRAFPEDLERMGYKLTPVTVAPNTLIIGNTSGWHARGDAIKPSVRNAVHGAIRVETPYDTYA